VFFIGPLADQERDILAFLRVNKSAGVDDVASFTGRPREDVKKIMDELYALRVVRNINDVYFAV
jgi:predicted transcriptional regulator